MLYSHQLSRTDSLENGYACPTVDLNSLLISHNHTIVAIRHTICVKSGLAYGDSPL